MPIKEAIKERLKHPIVGTFAVSFCLWNYELTLFILSTAGVAEKVAMIKSLSCTSVTYPILATAIYFIFLIVTHMGVRAYEGFLERVGESSYIRGLGREGTTASLIGKGKRYEEIRDHVMRLIVVNQEFKMLLNSDINSGNGSLPLFKEKIRVLREHPKSSEVTREVLLKVIDKMFAEFEEVRRKHQENPLFVNNLGEIAIAKK